MTEPIDAQDEFVKLILRDLDAFQSKHARPLTPEEKASFIAGHAAGYGLGRRVETATLDRPMPR